MTKTHLVAEHGHAPLRLWPGILIAALQLPTRFLVPLVMPGIVGGYISVLGGLVGALAVALWWLFFSRAAWVERIGGILLMIGGLAATRLILHESVATGMMGMMFFIYAVPVLSVAFVAWAVVTRRLPDPVRRITMVATIVAACAAWGLLRTDGITGEGGSQFAWRWSPTHEERLLAELRRTGIDPASSRAETPVIVEERKGAEAAGERSLLEEQTAEEMRGEGEGVPVRGQGMPAASMEAVPQGEAHDAAPSATRTADAAATAAPRGSGIDWPGFRGPRRDGIVHGVRIDTNWSASPPAELWRRPVGPGWSSFAVDGNRIYTQEQLGDSEIVACYDLRTGEPVWRHRDAARFWESNAGPGPRATPTLSRGRVYTFGATGLLNALDAATGARVWSRNVSSDAETEIPGWGFASSPLVVNDQVIVAAAGRLAAYDAETGEPRWFGPAGGSGYSSPQLTTLDGVPQVVLLRAKGAIGVVPSDGTIAWEHEWRGDGIVQPALVDGDVLIGSGSGMAAVGVRRIAVDRSGNGWTITERWTSNGLKPYFNDFVLHRGLAFGFDGRLLACIDLETGARVWKGGRYGHGQLVLLAEQDLLLVLSEEGELALVRAGPDRFEELARVPAIEGKTWNHPVLAGGVLLVRNGHEMAAFRLAPASR
jgi:outer membrane protein assembly factor BamB